MSEERGKDSPSEMSLSRKHSVRSGSHVSSSVSVKSDRSKEADLPNFSEVTASQTKCNRLQKETSDPDFHTNRNHKDFTNSFLQIFQDIESKIISFLKKELDKFQKILQKEDLQYIVKDFNENRCIIKEAALDLTLYFLREMKQDDAADTLEDELFFIHQLKCSLKKKYQCVFEGIAKQGDSTLLNNIYTDLYITQGCSDHVNTEHEVRQIEVTSRRHESQEIQVECKHLFEAPEQDKQIRTVLTKGVAGIGKSVSVQKFVLDWAEGKENQDISFIFPLPFREMNLKEQEKQSFMDLITQFFPETKGLNLTRRNQKVLFILDGLDEFRLPLNFNGNEMFSDISSSVSLDVIVTNLIKGNLLPSALIWITTRPAAASKIPPDCIDRLTEIRGFNDVQKEEYFRKRITDENMAKEIIDHVKQSKSLFIMCHIPVFCWISATVLQNILEEKRNNDLKNNQADDVSKTLQSNTEDTPKTLTQMYTYFLRFQIQQSRRKYDGEYTPDVSWDKDAIFSLGKLAFHQLERNNVIFYDTDLEACGIDVYKASVYSGVCTQIFKEETGIVLGTMYCFVHLSIQEFIAALYAHLFLDIKKKSIFVHELSLQSKKNMIDLLKTAVDKALESENGHLDLFLRFLLGLSLQSNRQLLKGLLTQSNDNDKSKEEIVQYIKQKFEANLSPERSINLFYCLNELNDQTLVKDIQTHLSKGSLSSADLSPAQWSALAFVLLTSEEELEEFELQKFKKSDECLIRLSTVIKTSKRALLNDCGLTDKSCSALATVLGSDTSLKELNMSNNNLQDSGVQLLCTGLENMKCHLEILRLNDCGLTNKSCSALATVLESDTSLKELNMSNNNLQDSGVKLLCTGLENMKCHLEIMRLSNCSITEEGYKALASALRSNPSHLIELDLTGNDPGQSGVKELNDLLQDPNCQLKTLRFLGPAADEACQYVTGIVGKNLLLQRELNLSKHELGDTRVNQIAAVLQDKHCKLNTLILNNSCITEGGCCVLAAALNSNPLNLTELDLSENKLGNPGMKIILTLFENIQCRLEKLKLSNCSITEEGYKALASALTSNPSHLIELDLTGNDPGQSGVKELNDLLQDPNCQLKTLRFLGPAADEACQYVTGIVGKNPLLLRELNLSKHELGDTRVNQIAALLEDKHCQLNTLILNNNCITEGGCRVLAAALNSNPSNLTELDLSENKLGNPGMKIILTLFENVQCRLEKLKLSNCRIAEEGYKALASALRSNTSHLIELDLTGNDPGQSGVKELNDLLQDELCSLKTIRFLKSPAAEEACEYLTEVLGKSPLLLKELDLSEGKLGDLDGDKLSALLMDSHSKLEKIMLNNSALTEKSCSVLAAVLSSKTILNEMDLNNSRVLDSGVKVICEGLKNPVCELKILKLSNCSITEEGYKALASALRSNPSHLIELDLTGNDPGQSGVKELNDLLQDPNCQLKTLRFLGPAADEACQYVTRIVGKNPLLLRELNLSKRELGDTRVNQIAALLEDKHCQLNTLILSNCSITEEGYKALASALRSNPSHLIELDLTGNDPGQSGVKELNDVLQDPNCQLKTLRFLGPAAEEGCQYVTGIVGKNPLLLRELNLSKHELGDTQVNQIAALLQDKHCQLNTLSLNNNCITEEGCRVLAAALNSNPSNLTELDLSENKLGNPGIKIILTLFENVQCRLEKLKLSCISITDDGCAALASVFNSNIRELDLSRNQIGDSGVTEISSLLRTSQCTLQILRLSNCSVTEEGYKALASALRSNPSHLIELDLTGNDPGQSGVKELTELLQDPNCQLKTLRFLGPVADEACQYVTGIVGKNLLLLRELNLSKHELGDTRVNQIAALLEDKHCKLNTLILSNCSITEEGYKALASALRSNPSHLIELDLTGNDPGQSGVKELNDLLQDPNCQLKTLRFLGPAAEEGCQYVTEIVGKNPLLLRELNLSKHELGDTQVNQIAALLEDKHCKLNTLSLYGCSITEKQCLILTSALKSNPSHLRELNLSLNKLGDSGVKNLSDLLMNPQFKLEKLDLWDCSITEEQCLILTSALKSNPSHLRQLDLSRNKLGDSGVKNLSDLLMNPQFKLEKLDLWRCIITEEQCLILTSALKSNPSHLRELYLSWSKLGNSGVKNLSDLLMNPQFKLETLHLYNCGITDVSSLTQSLTNTKALQFLKELDLSGNNIGDSKQRLIDVLRDSNCKLSVE
ncbi:uncharacterized protein [Garra rufa]|uniref:uncharacterized protein n=1 Tax=Garra rufa TaxID=137080 RepID=UPI003CCE7AE1